MQSGYWSDRGVNCLKRCAIILSIGKSGSFKWSLAKLELSGDHEGGTHCVFIRSDGRTLPIPAHRPIKPIYVKKFIRLVDGD